MVEQKFESYCDEPGVSEEELRGAEFSKNQYFQQLEESQNKLLGMFEAADINGDGVISFTEVSAWRQKVERKTLERGREEFRIEDGTSPGQILGVLE